MTWKLEGAERAYEHFGPPFLLTTSSFYQKIRNIQLRILPDDVLLAIEVSKYDQKVVLEALHNCIAHQDYMQFYCQLKLLNHHLLQKSLIYF